MGCFVVCLFFPFRAFSIVGKMRTGVRTSIPSPKINDTYKSKQKWKDFHLNASNCMKYRKASQREWKNASPALVFCFHWRLNSSDALLGDGRKMHGGILCCYVIHLNAYVPWHIWKCHIKSISKSNIKVYAMRIAEAAALVKHLKAGLGRKRHVECEDIDDGKAGQMRWNTTFLKIYKYMYIMWCIVHCTLFSLGFLLSAGNIFFFVAFFLRYIVIDLHYNFDEYSVTCPSILLIHWQRTRFIWSRLASRLKILKN